MQDSDKTNENMENKEIIIENLAEDLLFDFKSVCPTDLTYQWIDEESGFLSTKTTPKGQFLKERMMKTITKHLK